MERRRQAIYRFGGMELDAALGCLTRNGQQQHLRQKTLQVLLYLIEQRQRPVTREALRETVWPAIAVGDNALEQCLAEIRRSLGDDSRRPRFVKTIPKVGYCFISPVEEIRPAEPSTIQTREVTTVEIEYEEESADPILAARTIHPVLPAARLNRWDSRRRLPIVIAAALLAAGAALAVSLRQTRQSSIEVTLPQVAGKKSLAVMYFENQSNSRDLDWLREGLADMLITDLSRTRRLTVLGRQQLHLLLERIGHHQAEAIRLDDAIEIGRRSQAEAVVLGSFARLGEKIRITVNLYDARDGQPLASEGLVADKPEDILGQMDLLSLKLAAHLGASADEQAGRTSLAGVMTNNLDAYRYYSLALEKAQAYHTTEALDLWERAARLDPQFAMAYARMGYTCALIRVNEDDKGRAYLAKAFQLSHRLTEKDKLYINAWYAVANGDKPGGIQLLREIIATYPEEVEAYLRLGYLLGHAGHPEEAITIYKRGLLIDPDARDIHNALGFACSSLGRYDEAIAAHQRYVQLAPTEPNAHDSLGMTYNEAGRYDAALNEFEQALALNPDFHFARLHLGDVFFLLGRYRAAIREYVRFLELAPSNWDAAVGHHRLVLLYLKKGDLRQAEAAARQEARFKNDLGGALLIALARGNLQAAAALKAQLFGKSSEGCPPLLTWKGAYYLRGWYALKTGQATVAIEQLKEALRQAPRVWNVDGVEDCLAAAYLELGQLPEAIAEYERLISVNPNWPLIHYHLAQAYERMGERQRARDEYERFLELWKGADSDIPALIAARKQLGIQS